jgi:hypothetical protein
LIGAVLAIAAAGAVKPPSAPAPAKTETVVLIATIVSDSWDGWYYDHCREGFFKMGTVEDNETPSPENCMTHGGEVNDVRITNIEVLEGPPGVRPARVGIIGHARMFTPGEEMVIVLERAPAALAQDGIEWLATDDSRVFKAACVELPPSDREPPESMDPDRGCYSLKQLYEYYAPEAKEP